MTFLEFAVKTSIFVGVFQYTKLLNSDIMKGIVLAGGSGYLALVVKDAKQFIKPLGNI